jgi:hypothetical protein
MNFNPKQIVPRRTKVFLKKALLGIKLGQALRRIVASPETIPERRVLTDLTIGWGNEGFAARLDYLEEVARNALTTNGPILECGSGITTLLMGILAGHRGIEVWSLEHSDAWCERMRKVTSEYAMKHVKICHSPLTKYDGFTWYDPPLESMPSEFSLVVCDGPPGDTPGGRFGLLPVLKNRLVRGTTILLDDTDRETEIEVLAKWNSQGQNETRFGPEASFASVKIS